MSTTYTGIDYGHGNANVDRATGIRYGVIAQGSINSDAFDDVWQNARDLSFEHCVAEFKRQLAGVESAEELAALIDEQLFNADAFDTADLTFPLSELALADVWNELEQPFCDGYMDNGERDWLYEADGYKLTNCLSTDIFVLASPYYTYAQFCSPCVPGACNLDSPLPTSTYDVHENNRCYCLGHDYFDDGKSPYPVYSVATGELVQPAA